MPGYSAANPISAYKSVATHGVAHQADPHQLISMLFDGALERLTLAKSHIERKELIAKATVLHRVVEIIIELRESLNPGINAELVNNLDSLYDYMIRRLLAANLNNDAAAVDEVSKLLRPIRDAWCAIPVDARSAHAQVVQGSAP